MIGNRKISALLDAIPDASEGWTSATQWRQKPEGRE